MIYKQILFGIVLLIISNVQLCFGQDDFNRVDFYASACLTDCRLFRLQERIVSQELINDTLTIKITKITNCADNKIGYAKRILDTLYLSSSGLPDYEIDKAGDSVRYFWQTDCDCGYDFTFKISSKQKYDWVKYNEQFIYHHDNRLKDNQYKVIGKDTLLNIEDYRRDCYATQGGRDGYICCYGVNSKLRSMCQIDSLNNKIISIFDEKGSQVFMLHEEQESNQIKVYNWTPNGLIEFLKTQSIEKVNFGDYYDDVDWYLSF